MNLKVAVKPVRQSVAPYHLRGRTRHCDGRKVAFFPVKAEDGLEMRGMGGVNTEKKVVARPYRGEQGLEFRTITQCPCIDCWSCNGETPEDIVEIPEPYTTVRVKTQDWVGSCCESEIGGTWMDMTACTWEGLSGDPLRWNHLTYCGGCEDMFDCYSLAGPYALWYGEVYSTDAHDCDTAANPTLFSWAIHSLLRTYCCYALDGQLTVWAWLRMLFIASWGPEAYSETPACCLPPGHYPPDEHYALYEGCVALTSSDQYCGAFENLEIPMCHYNPGTMDCGTGAFQAVVDKPEPV